MKNEAQKIVSLIRDLLWSQNDHVYDKYINDALAGSDEDFWLFLESNELWGGAGSIADQACIGNKEAQKVLYKLLSELAAHQEKAGRINVRTKSWASAFNEWRE